VTKQRVLKAVLPSAAVVGLTGVAGAVVVAAHAAGADSGASTSQVGAAQAAETENYWTPERMASATPVDRPAAPLGSKSAMAVRSGLPRAKAFGGYPSVGALFFRNGRGNHYCTASAVDSSKRNLVITAAHCLWGSGGADQNIAYVPGYNAGRRPYGVWPVKQVTVMRQWKTKRDDGRDFGFAAVYDQGGRRLGDVTGYNVLTVNRGYRNWVQVVGYPQVHYVKSDHPIRCSNRTKEKMKWQVEFDCSGYYGGTSGSPFVWHASKRGTGRVIGVLGGYQEGGVVDYISYASYFDHEVWDLRAAANRSA
jgi:V8-like Glu-specific endopeptidase